MPFSSNQLGLAELKVREVHRKWLSNLAKYGIGIALLAFVVYRHWEPDQHGGIGLKAALSGPIRWELFFFAALCCGGSAAITFVRWFLLVRAQDLPFTLRNAFRLGLIGYFFNTFLPGAVGGDLVKATFIAREQRRRTVAVSTVLMDRAIGLLGLIAIVAVIGTTFWLLDNSVLVSPAQAQPSDSPSAEDTRKANAEPAIDRSNERQAQSRVLMRQVIRLADGITISAILAWILLGALPEHRSHIFARRLHHIPKIGKILAEMWRAVFLYRRRGLTILYALVLTLVSHTLNVLTFYLAALAFQPIGGTPRMPGLLEHFILVPAGMAFQGFIPTPGGIGGTEWLYSAFYWGFGFPGEGGVLGSLGMRLVQWVLGLCGYIVYLFMKHEMPVEQSSVQISTDSNSPEPVSSTMQDL
jgi:uncharacterized membrane protein YbhN (UPF0104 family)